MNRIDNSHPHGGKLSVVTSHGPAAIFHCHRHPIVAVAQLLRKLLGHPGVAVQVEFERQRLETSFSLDRLKGWVTRRFQAVGQLTSTVCVVLQQRFSATRCSTDFN
jgi:hypothetical protein